MTDTLHGAGRLLNPARLLVALAAFIGVLGMHGFSADHTLAGPTMTAIHSAQPTASPAGMTHEDAVAISTERRASATAVVSQSGCPMSHIDCLATLRSIPQGKHPIGAGLPVPTGPAGFRLTTASTLMLIVGRSPPDLCLTRLCISRT
jgi:hypothetical protein